ADQSRPNSCSEEDAHHGCRCTTCRGSSGPSPAQNTRTTRPRGLHTRVCRLAWAVNRSSSPGSGRRHWTGHVAADRWHKYGAVLRANHYGTNRLERFEFHYLFGHYWCGQSWYDDRLVTVDRPCWASPIAIGLAGRNGHFGGGARGGVFGQP